MDFESGFWQVLLHETSRDKTAFFVPGGQKRWTVMPMGCLNAHGIFCCLVDTLKRHWNKNATSAGIRDDIEVTLKGERPWTDAEVIVDDIMLHSENPEPLIKYFEIVLQTLQKYQVTVKLKKCRFFPQSAEFVGMDVEADGNRPARSKMQALNDLKDQSPKTLTDLRQLIGLIGFYQDWIANYELRIGRWRQHIKQLKGTQATEGEIQLDTTWTNQDQELLKELLDELISRPTLARPDYTRRFYLKTDWCRLGMAAVLLQADPNDPHAHEKESNEANKTQACAFDKPMHKLRLRPIAFSSRKCSENEGGLHSYTGEAATGVWAIEKYKRHLFGREFTWMTDCNGLRQFFEGDDVTTHMHQRMRQRLLRFMFTIVHRPARFMAECDTLTRYNNMTTQWRANSKQESNILQNPIPISNDPIPQLTNCSGAPRALLATKSNTYRTIWAFNAGATNIHTAITEAGITADIVHVEERQAWKTHPFDRHRNDPTLTTIVDLEATLEPTDTVDWIIGHEGTERDKNEQESQQQFEHITQLINLGSKHGIKAIILFMRPNDGTHTESRIERRVQELEATGWNALRATVHAHRYGAGTATQFTMIAATQQVETLRTFHLVQGSDATPLSEIIEDELEIHEPQVTNSEIRDMTRPQKPEQNPNEPRIAAFVQRARQDNTTREAVVTWTPCYDKGHPGPDLNDTTIQWYESPFAIESTDQRTHTSIIRGIRHHELVNLIGYDEESRFRMLQQPPEMALAQARTTPPKLLLTAALMGMYSAESITGSHTTTDTPSTPYDEEENIDSNLRQALTVMLAQELQQTATLPLPTTAQWQDATTKDWDLHTIAQALRDNRNIQKDAIQSATLYKLWADNMLEEDNGILYHTGRGTANRRHLRVRVVPPRLRQAIFSALHAAPMAGHTGFQKTFWKIAARYYWPNMTADIRQLTLGCGHCNVANIASHEAQQQLQAFAADEPFDVITMDVWHPGKAATIRKGNGTHVVTCIDTMTGFAAATFVDSLDSETMTKAAFTAFFITHGLPRLVVIDSGSEFAGALVILCQGIGLPHYTVSKGNHKAIICERFHKYLNKVQKIHAADCETFQDFMFGTIFAVYAWNSAPVDGTNIVRSYAAIGREFLFPIDFEREPIVPRDNTAQGQQTIEHVDSAFPLWRRQQEILKTLVDDRREHHRQLKNDGRTMKTFAPGDLVLVKKQTQTTDEKGPAKARMQARGPYRVLEQLKPGTYRIQRLPAVKGAGRRGRVVKESAARLTRIPSTLVLHKPTDGIDTRLATYRHAIVDNPLENILGLYEPGRYKQTEDHRPFAYDKIEDLWNDDIDNNWPMMINDDSNDTSSEDSNDSDADDDDGNDDAQNNGNANNSTTDEDRNNTDNNTADTDANFDDNESNKTNTDNVDTNPNTTTTQNDSNDRTVTYPHDTPTDAHTNSANRAKHSDRKRKTTSTTMQDSTRNNAKPHGKKKQKVSITATSTNTQTRTSGRTTRKPTRYEQHDHTTATATTKSPAETITQQTRTKQAHQLYKRIRKSRDKLFFIKHIIDTTNTTRWYVVQAKLDDDDDDNETTRNEGYYRVWFYIREHSNSKSRQLRNCRYWPEVHELRPNGTLGPITPIRPGRVDTVLREQPHKYKIYEHTVDLLKDALVGPFDFAIPKHYQDESHRIAFEEWEDLKSAAQQYKLDTTNIEDIIPLR